MMHVGTGRFGLGTKDRLLFLVIKFLLFEDGMWVFVCVCEDQTFE